MVVAAWGASAPYPLRPRSAPLRCPSFACTPPATPSEWPLGLPARRLTETPQRPHETRITHGSLTDHSQTGHMYILISLCIYKKLP